MAAAGRIEINTSLNRQGAERDFQRLQASMQSGAQKMKSVGETMSKAITVPLAGLGAAAISSAKSVGDAQAKIQSSLGVTKKEAENLTNVARNIYKAGFGESLDEVSDALIKTKQNMKNINSEAELQTATKNALALAKTFDADVNEVTRGGGQLMKAFGIDSKKAFDLMAYGAQNGLNFSDEMFDNLSEYAPLFGKMGYSADEYFQLLIKGSKNGAYNLDYVNDVFKEFQIRVKDGSKSTKEAMGQLSSGTQKVWKDFLQGKGTVKDVANAVLPELKGMDDQVAANNIGVALFGTKWEDLESDAMYSMGNIKGSLDESAGAMDKVTKAQEQSFGQQFQATLRQAADALEPIGRIILDMAQRALPIVQQAIQVLSDKFKSLSPTGQTVVVVMGGIAAAIGPLLMVLSSMLPAITAIVTNFGTVVTVATKVGGAIKTIGTVFGVVSKLFMTNPILIAITAIAAAVYLVIKYWEPISEFFKGLWDGIVSVAKTIWDGLKAYFTFQFNLYKTIFTTVWNAIKSFAEAVWNGIVVAAQTIWEGLKLYFTTLLNFYKTIFTTVWNAIKTAVTAVWNGIVTAGKAIWEGLKTFFTNFLNGLKIIFTTVWNAIKTATTTVWNGIVTVGKSVWNGLKTFFTNLLNGFKKIFTTIWNGIKTVLTTVWKGISSVAKTVWNALKTYFTNALNFYKSLFSRIWNGIKSTVVNIWKGISSAGKSIWNGLKSFFSSLWNGIKNTASRVFNGMKNVVNNIWNGMKSSARSAWNLIKTYVVNPVNNIKNKVVSAFNNIKSGVLGVWDGIKSGIRSSINWIIGKINSFTGGFSSKLKVLNKIPGVNIPSIPKIPMLATGGRVLRGKAIVGEAGPELLDATGSTTKVIPLSSKEKAAGISGALGNINPTNINNNFDLSAMAKAIQQLSQAVLNHPIEVNIPAIRTDLSVNGRQFASATQKDMTQAQQRQAFRDKRRYK